MRGGGFDALRSTRELRASRFDRRGDHELLGSFQFEGRILEDGLGFGLDFGLSRIERGQLEQERRRGGGRGAQGRLTLSHGEGGALLGWCDSTCVGNELFAWRGLRLRVPRSSTTSVVSELCARARRRFLHFRFLGSRAAGAASDDSLGRHPISVSPAVSGSRAGASARCSLTNSSADSPSAFVVVGLARHRRPLRPRP